MTCGQRTDRQAANRSPDPEGRTDSFAGPRAGGRGGGHLVVVSATRASPTHRRVSRQQDGLRLGRLGAKARDAQDSLDEEADSLEQAIEQLTGAARAIGTVLAGGVQTVAEVTRLDPELARTALDTSTCQQLHAERDQ